MGRRRDGRVCGGLLQEGVSALFKGCLLGWVKLAPSAGLSFYCYEAAKEVLEL